MTTWICLLRGVNVGGVTVRSDDLRTVFEDLGYPDARTVLATGNVVFDTDAADVAALASTIETALSERFDYDASVILISAADLRAECAGFPFNADDDARQPWVIVCRDAATRDELIGTTTSSPVDPLAAGARVVYWHPVKGTSTDTPFAKVLARRAFRTRTTNRNLRTVGKILAVAS